LLRFFRVNDPYRLLAILVLIILFALPLLLRLPPLSVQELRNLLVGEAVSGGQIMYVQIYDSTAPFAAGIFGAVDWLFGRSMAAREVLTILLFFFQAAFFSVLLINNKAYNDNNYVPGLVFAILCFISYDFFSLSTELLGSTLLLLALNHLFREIEFRIQREETILSLGVYLGAASIFVFSYTIFLFGVALILTLFTRMSVRKLLLLLLGFALPHGLLFLIYLRWDEARLLWQNFYVPNLSIATEPYMAWRSLLYLLAVPAIYFLIALFMMTREARFTKYQSQLFQVMFLWLLVALAEVAITRERSPHSFLTTLPSLTYFISHYLLLIRRRWIAETMLWILLAGILTIGHLARLDRVSAISYAQLQLPPSSVDAKIQNKKLMVLGNNMALYRHHPSASYFLDWSLAKETVTDLSYYDHVLKVEAAFRTHPPEVVVDLENAMPAILARIPALRAHYRKDSTGNYYYRN
jgi:hypothetical protein